MGVKLRFSDEDDENVGVESGRTVADVSRETARQVQKQLVKKGYAAKKRAENAQKAAETAKKAGEAGRNVLEKTLNLVREHAGSIVLAVIFGGFFIMFTGGLSSCSMALGGTGNVLLASSYTAEDADIRGANADYQKLEENLQKEIDTVETTHPGYDEYRYQLDEINHNPYVLTSYLTVMYEDYSRSEVQSALKELCDRQYELTMKEEVETRTREVSYTETDPMTGEVKHKTRRESYSYYILNVILKNKSMEVAVAASGLTADQQERYGILLETKGNRAYLFADDIYANATGDYLKYDIPGEALTNEKFANMVREAEKYLGMAYVWGGDSPSTGFGCSGFISYVLNHCGNGWNVGRQTANGLKNMCAIIPADAAQPGDLIFFQGTYDTPGASHVGIYVGNGMMLHCGNPISYASINTKYWKQHFYCFGRIE